MSVLEFTDQKLNYYECPECDQHWYDIWDCEVDHQCPRCNLKAVSPKHSWELPDGGVDELCVWEGAFEYLDDKEYDYEG